MTKFVSFFSFMPIPSKPPSNPNTSLSISLFVCVCVIPCHCVLRTMYFNCVYANYIPIKFRNDLRWSRSHTVLNWRVHKPKHRAQLGQGIRIGGGSVMPITGPGGLHQHANTHQHMHHHSVDRRTNGHLRVSISSQMAENEQSDLILTIFLRMLLQFAAWRGSQVS